MKAINGYNIISLDHKNIALSDLGNLLSKAYAVESFEDKCAKLKTNFNLDEVFVLTTCNRISIISYKTGGIQDSDTSEMLRQWFNPPVDIDNYISGIRVFNGKEAVRYLFSLMASLDSLIVGEREILHQMRTAYAKGMEMDMCGDHLRLLIDQGVRTVKRIYNETKIGEQPVSVVSIAMRKIGISKSAKPLKYALVGAGQTMHLVAKFLKKTAIESVDIFNRTPKKAERIGEILGGKIHSLNELNFYKDEVDVLIVCTNSKDVIIDKSFKSLSVSAHVKIIDLGVPRNVAEQVADMPNVHYTGMDQLRCVAKTNADLRKGHVVVAEDIISEDCDTFLSSHFQRQLEKAMSDVPREIRAVKQKAINEVFDKKLSNLDNEAKALVLEMMDYMEKKCIGIPIKAAKSAATSN